MAPSILEAQPPTGHTLSKTLDRKNLTSGQHPPIQSALRPYSEFPKKIQGQTVWKSEDYQNNPERWIHDFSEDELEELSTVADKFIAEEIPLTEVSKETFPLTKLSQLFGAIRKEIIDGKGFILFKGFPTQKWGNHKSAVAYMGLGTYFGNFVSQNGRGHILGHVKDLGEDPTQIDKVRIYRTNARYVFIESIANSPNTMLIIPTSQFFHADDSDIVGLLCIARSLEGGESDLVSAHHVWNVLQEERPDVAETLTKPIWYFDRKGEESEGEEPYIRTSIFYLETGTNGRVYSKWDPYYVKSLTRFSSAGLIPALSPEQLEAAQVLEDTCQRLRMHMILEEGDIQILSNNHVFHARGSYKDRTDGIKRHLMRLWLATPENEGGWKLPFHDSAEKRRGGIQVNNTPAVCPLDGE
jgi:hypothetical protein